MSGPLIRSTVAPACKKKVQERGLFVPPERRKHEIVDDRQVVEGGGNLKCLHHTRPHPFLGSPPGDVFTLEQNRAVVRGIVPGDEVEKCCLAGAVGTDYPGDFILTQHIVYSVNGDEIAESLCDIFRSDYFRSLSRSHR